MESLRQAAAAAQSEALEAKAQLGVATTELQATKCVVSHEPCCRSQWASACQTKGVSIKVTAQAQQGAGRSPSKLCAHCMRRVHPRSLTERREARGRKLVSRLTVQRADAQREASLLRLRLDGCRLGSLTVTRNGSVLGGAAFRPIREALMLHSVMPYHMSPLCWRNARVGP